MTTEVTPGATEVTPPANDGIDSLLPPDDKKVEDKKEEPKELLPTAEELAATEKVAADKAAADAAAAAEKPKWHYADGTPGKGEPPEWFKANKYVTVEEQAKAYTELEKRFGSFVGAPKDGKYELKLPEGVTGEFEPGHPLLDKFQKFAATAQMSQEGFDQVLGMLVEYEASQAPNIADIKKQIGEDADARIGAVASWAKANLDANGYNELRSVLGTKEAPGVFKLFEAVIAKTRQAVLPKPGEDGSSVPEGGLAAITKLKAARNDKGQLLVHVDQAYRERVEKMTMEFFKGQQA